jgi:hypothetical protein
VQRKTRVLLRRLNPPLRIHVGNAAADAADSRRRCVSSRHGAIDPRQGLVMGMPVEDVQCVTRGAIHLPINAPQRPRSRPPPPRCARCTLQPQCTHNGCVQPQQPTTPSLRICCTTLVRQRPLAHACRRAGAVQAHACRSTLRESREFSVTHNERTDAHTTSRAHPEQHILHAPAQTSRPLCRMTPAARVA